MLIYTIKVSSIIIGYTAEMGAETIKVIPLGQYEDYEHGAGITVYFGTIANSTKSAAIHFYPSGIVEIYQARIQG